MTLQEFVSTYTGKDVSYDGVQANRGQCEQLVCVYWDKVYGFKCPPIPAAKDLWTNSAVLSKFERISVGQEQPGDVAVWGASSLINSPEFGHTDIVLAKGTNGFTGVDSNWGGVKAPDGYPAAHQVQHTYVDVLGFLRFKQEEAMVNKGDVVNLYEVLLGRAPDAEGLKGFVGQPWNVVFYHIIHSAEYAERQKSLSNPTVLKPGTYRVL